MTEFNEQEWQEAKAKFEKIFGEGLEMDGLLFLIGVQELGQGFRKFEKDEKMNLMHIAACKLLEPFQYYRFSHRDEQGWPHYDKSDNLPGLSKKDQDRLLKQAIIKYSRTALQIVCLWFLV
ncbi:MAG: hypothetical protein ACPGRC_06580 [Salibacteraceae bacterium]